MFINSPDVMKIAADLNANGGGPVNPPRQFGMPIVADDSLSGPSNVSWYLIPLQDAIDSGLGELRDALSDGDEIEDVPRE